MVVIEIESSKGRSIEEITEEIAKAIAPGEGLKTVRIAMLLREFAEEIKREAIEP